MHCAKIQIRPFNEEVISFVFSQIKKESIIIDKQKKLKEGLDIYINDASFSIQLSKKFKKNFNGETKITRSLIGEDKKKGKRIYRVTVLLRFLQDPKPL